MNKIYLPLFILLSFTILSSKNLSGQTTVFSDDFSSFTNAAYSTSGNFGGSAWTISPFGPDWGARRNIAPAQLELTNDAGATANVDGNVLVSTPTTGFAAPYNPTLALNSAKITWTLNMRQIRLDPAGFSGSNSYGVAFILAGTPGTNRTSGTGYAVTLGQSGTTDALRLVAFNAGLANQTNIISSNTAGLTDFGTEYLSIRIEYTPATNTWELFLRNDGAAAFADPSTGPMVSQGSVVNSAYTASALNMMGALWQGSTGAGQTSFFDNVAVKVNSGATTTVSVSAGTTANETGPVNGTFNINLASPAPAGGVTVNYTLGSVAPNEATAGSDYSNLSTGSVFIPETGNNAVVTINTINDAAFEGTEIISITLNSATNSYTIGSPSATSINLLDNDAPPTVSVAAGSGAAEPASNGTFIINFSAATTGPTTINYSYTGVAGFGTDYNVSYSTGVPSGVTSTGTLTVGAGVTSVTVTVTPVDDPLVEPDESITLTISSPSSPYTLGTAAASINLTSDDFPPFLPIPLTGLLYTQDYNTLSNTGTSNNILFLQGWQINESGGGTRDNELYAADNGAATTGDTYSYGTTGSTERALGALASGSLESSFGAYFINNTGSTVNSVKIIYTGEQWRQGVAATVDKLNFQYSTDATMLSNGTWADFNQLDFNSPVTGATGAKDGNLAANRKLISYTIHGLSIPNGGTLFIRWADLDGPGFDDGLAVDDFSIETNPVDLNPPVITSLSPANGSTNVSLGTTSSIIFDEDVLKGTGNVYLKKVSDNSIVQTIDVNTPAVTVSSNNVSFTFNLAGYGTAYYVEIDAGAFKDYLNNNFAGITGSADWTYTTEAAPAAGIVGMTYNFNTCSGSLPDGFKQYSVQGAQTWACSVFGHDGSDVNGLLNAANGIEMNGFSGGTNYPNKDWLISPPFDLTATTYPLLSFWSRTAFNGLPLQLKISTDYFGGDPLLATWTDLNGHFPGLASNKWTESANINLSAFKQGHVNFAFVYTSSDEDGARWTVDDITVTNSATPPPPSLTISTNDIQFSYVAAGSNSDKTFTFIGNDLTGNVTLNVTGDFLISRDGTNFSTSISYTLAEANDQFKTVSVRFAPSVNNQDFTGSITINTSSLSGTVSLKGTSINPAGTLEVVNWNVEWFGSTLEGPSNDNQQEQNVKTILQNIGADIYGLTEIVDESRMANVVSQMPGYSLYVGQFGSHVNPPETGGGPLSAAQKLGFIYKTSLFSNITARKMMGHPVGSPSYNNWSSGRYPYLFSADLTLNCITKRVHFILIHAKANTNPTLTSYQRREAAANELRDSVNTYFAEDLVIILGDFNDDLDKTITAEVEPPITSYHSFMDDPVNFYSPTKWELSDNNKKSTVSYNEMIDHVMLTNEMVPYYMTSSANVLTDVSSLVTNYGSTTTDHYPVFTRYRFELPQMPTIQCPPAVFKINDPGACGAIANYTVNPTVYCGEGVVEQIAGLPSGSLFPVGTTNNIFRVTDGAGQIATCSFTVTIYDDEAPHLLDPNVGCTSLNQSNVNLCLSGVINNASMNQLLQNVLSLYTDNCNQPINVQLFNTIAGPNNSSCNWNFRFQFRIKDAQNNTTNCEVTWSGGDNEAPHLANPLVNCSSLNQSNLNQCLATAQGFDPNSLNAMVDALYADNCDNDVEATHVYTFPGANNTNCSWSFTYRFAIVDNCSNNAFCDVVYSGGDYTSPTFTVPADKTILYNSPCGYNASPANTGAPTLVSDNCGETVDISYVDVVSYCGNNTVITRTWKAMDVCGNHSTQPQTITVTDNNSLFIIYATKEAKFGESNTINGDVGVTDANGKAEFKKNSVLDPNHVYAKNITVQLPATVNNKHFVPATGGPNPPFFAYGGGALAGNYTQNVNGIVPAGNFKNLTIKKNVTATVNGNNYGKVSIEEGATVTFTSGSIDMEELSVGKGKKGSSLTTVIFTNCTGLRVKDRVTIEEDTRVNVGGPKVIVYLGDSKKDEENFTVKGDNAQVTLNIMIPKGKLKVNGGNSNAIMTGWFVIEKLESDGKNVTWDPYECAPAPKGPVTESKTPASKTIPVVASFKATVSPNPSSHHFILRTESSNDQEAVVMRIVDLSGRIVSSRTGIIPNSTFIAGQELKTGVYFMELSQGNKKSVLKLVKL